MREAHRKVGQYLRDIVFAANDGVITTFAVVAGVVGAQLSAEVILIIGLANLIADGFSMATGNYLGTKSEKELYEKEEAVEKREIKEIPARERQEITELLTKKGYQGQDLEDMARLVSGNERYWVDFMMHEELGLFLPGVESPTRHAVATFGAFILAGAMPLVPYVIFGGDAFFLSALFSGLTLFVIGALRKFFSRRSWFWSGLEMLVIGGVAGGLAYVIGYLLQAII